MRKRSSFLFLTSKVVQRKLSDSFGRPVTTFLTHKRVQLQSKAAFWPF